MDKHLLPAATREVASRIYVDLVGRSIALADQKAKMQAAPEELARLSFELAGAFQRVQDELDGTSAPKNQGFSPGAADFAKWTK